jgi:predicted Zn-dependent protease
MPPAARKPALRGHTPARAAARAEQGPLIVNIGRQGDGCTYRLDPLSKHRLKAAHRRARTVPTVFIGYTTRDEFEALQGPMWVQIVQMLTGVTAEQLSALGGVELHDPDNGLRRRVLSGS